MIRRSIPNAITCGNLLCGCLAIVQAFEGHLVWAAYLVGLAAVLDFFDGFAARMLKVSSPIGKDLDSLADMVTFGVVPGVVMFRLIGNAIHHQNSFFSDHYDVSYCAFLITIFSCIRLAKFNNDTRQSDSFIGLNTPSNSMIICSFPLIAHFQSSYTGFVNAIHNPWFLIVLSCILSFLLISEIPFFALKFKNFGWKDNEIRYILLGLSLLLLITLHYIGIPLIIVIYFLLSVVNNLLKKKAAA